MQVNEKASMAVFAIDPQPETTGARKNQLATKIPCSSHNLDLPSCCHVNFIRRHRHRGRGIRMQREQRRGVMGLELKIVNGRIEEYEDGKCRRTYGSNAADAHTDGGIVAVVTADGRIEEYRDGMCQRSYCSNAQKVRVSGGTLAVTLRDGRVAEFENGSCRRMY
ncbi:MAG: IceA2 protein [Bacteroidota bacterium]